MKNTFILVLFYILSFQLESNAQNTNIETQFSTYLENNFQEKIYVHTDKNAYLAGEILWLKVYNVEAYTNRPCNVSKVAYVEVLDKENKPVLQTKIGLTRGGGAGSLYLPATLVSGNYTLRAYTAWMKNFDPEFFFHKEINILNTLKDEPVSAKALAKKQYIVRFFPEGGNLVYGLKSKVAFRAVDSEGKSFAFSGAIVNSANDTIVRFQPHKFGIGSLWFTPVEGQSYKAVIIRGNEKQTASLPEVYADGAVLAVKHETGPVLKVDVQAKIANESTYTLVVHSGRKMVFTQSLNANKIAEGFSIPVNTLNDGIAHITLFNSAGRPLCERLYFKQPTHQLQISLKSDKNEYLTRQKVDLEIEQTANAVPASANFSLAVYRADSLLTEEADIVGSLLLNSELRGNIENINWYLENPSDEAMDNLMLTHGWSRFKWHDVLAAKQQSYPYQPEMQGHIVTARLSKQGSPVPNQTAFLSIPDKKVRLFTGISDNKGEVKFYTRDLYGQPEIIAQVDPRSDSLAQIEIISPFANKFSEAERPATSLKHFPADLLGRSVAMQVNNVFNSRCLNEEISVPVDSAAFYNHPAKVYLLDDYVRFTTTEEVLREYVPEVLVNIRKGEYHLNVPDLTLMEFDHGAPFIMVDGVPVFDDGESIIKFDPLKVQKLEVINRAFVYGQNIFHGITSFQTYKGDLAGFELPKQALVVDYEGMQNRKEFYSPMYEGDEAQTSRLPDYRTTLFWSANNQTDAKGKGRLGFFTSDLPGKYVVVVQSLSEQGQMGSQVLEFNVAKKAEFN